MRLMAWIQKSVEYKVGLGVAALLLLVVVEVTGTWLLVRQQATDALVVNVAGRQRMLSQRMSKNALLTAQGNAAAQEGMMKAATLFDTSLKGLLDGNTTLGLPPAPLAVRPTLDDLQAKWTPFKAAIETLNTTAPASAEFASALAEVVATNEALLTQADTATTAFQKAAEQKTQQMLWFLYAMAAVSAAVFAWTVWLVRRTVRPLHQLAAVATRLAQGDVSQAITVRTSDEVGQLAETLRALIAYLQNMAAAADQIASGDLSAQVRPLSERDALGQAFARMGVYLSDKARVAGRLAQGHIGMEFQPLSSADELGNAFAQMMTYLRFTATAAEHLAHGDLTAEVAAHSEEDALNLAFGHMINYQRTIAHAAEQLADGNLQVTITPQSAHDALGQAFATMLETLRRLITQLTLEARRLSRAAEQLEQSARQSGESTEAIAATMHEISNGTAQQSDSIERISGALEQLSRAIDGVAKGAQEQAVAVGKSAEVTGQINAAIQRVTHHAHDGARNAADAAAVAQRGASTVQAAIRGMEGIKGKVGLSAMKVKEMGKRSEQIGAIVATIDEIAGQTNLLALNAAIEAARAGAHGKGFAVVADEVRKLAEKSAKATREIAELVRGIRYTVAEAVGSMDDGVREVEDGVARAHEAGDALEAILASAESVRTQVDEIVEAAQRMEAGANELVTAMDSVSAVVEQNTAATEQMAASTGGLLNDIENIASVSEENNAAAESISASAQELSTQGQAVRLGTEMLTELAQNLLGQTRHFRLNLAEAEAPAAESSAIGFIVWDQSMATGVAKIDEQHQVLINKLNELTAAMRERQGQTQIDSIIQFLGQYVKEHFGYEEECMDKYNCPVAGANREAHAKFVETFTQLSARLKREGATAELVIMVQRQLSEWLVRHIRKVDTQLEPCVKAKAVAAHVKRQREAAA